MQRIAHEFDYSETTFVDSGGTLETGFDVRIFSPTTGLPFAGHPTLGTASVLREKRGITDDELVLNEQVGPITVTAETTTDGNELLFMEHPQPTTMGTIDTQTAAATISLSPDIFDTRFPAQIVSTGVPTLIIPVESLKAVKAATITDDVYTRLVDSISRTSIPPTRRRSSAGFKNSTRR